MNVQRELHWLIDTLNLNEAKQELHTIVDELNDADARELLARLHAMRRGDIDWWGFSR